MRVASFNLQNFRLRARDGQPVLDGAIDLDIPHAQQSVSRARADRVETANVINAAQADVLALQEVFDLSTLDYFHDTFLLQTGSPPYPYRYCLPGNDGRGLNVAALSRRLAINVKSHADLTGADFGFTNLPLFLRNQRIFRRDCLELELEAVVLFICHFKAPYPDAEKAHLVRKVEASAVRRIVEARFRRPEDERWIILGDFNEPARSTEHPKSALTPLTEEFSVDIHDRVAPGTDWTYEVPETRQHSRPDRIFVSPRLAREYPNSRPQIIRFGMRRGQGFPSELASDERPIGPHASDHALVYADFAGL